MPRIPAGTRVYAVGDIHGRLDLLRAMHEAILDDAADAAPARRVVVYLGDYIDRGPDSRGAVAELIEHPLPDFEAVYLCGNHESFLLNFLEDPRDAGVWMMNGGYATLMSYGVDPAAATGLDSRSQWLRLELEQRMPRAHLAFFEGLRLHHTEGDYLFVHAGIRPGVALEDQVEEDLLWIREPFLGSTEDLGRVVVHGHTPTREPVLRPNRLGLDTGACFWGTLTAAVLEGTEQRLLQV